MGHVNQGAKELTIREKKYSSLQLIKLLLNLDNLEIVSPVSGSHFLAFQSS